MNYQEVLQHKEDEEQAAYLREWNERQARGEGNCLVVVLALLVSVGFLGGTLVHLLV